MTEIDIDGGGKIVFEFPLPFTHPVKRWADLMDRVLEAVGEDRAKEPIMKSEGTTVVYPAGPE